MCSAPNSCVCSTWGPGPLQRSCSWDLSSLYILLVSTDHCSLNKELKNLIQIVVFVCPILEQTAIVAKIKKKKKHLLPWFLSPDRSGGEQVRQWLRGSQWVGEVGQDYFRKGRRKALKSGLELYLGGAGRPLMFKRVNLISKASSNWSPSPDLSGAFSWSLGVKMVL